MTKCVMGEFLASNSAYQNQQVIQRMTDALARGDLAAVCRHLSVDIECHVPGCHPLSGRYQGIDAVMSMLARVCQYRRGRQLQTSSAGMSTGERHVAVLTDCVAALPDARLSWRETALYFFLEQQVMTCWTFVDGLDDYNRYWLAGEGSRNTRSQDMLERRPV
jgi:ketosteroid isomerase-like protein